MVYEDPPRERHFGNRRKMGTLAVGAGTSDPMLVNAPW
jgi:hypothetical protein